jgi:DNA mismatch repair protein MutS
MFATHYHELCALAEVKKFVRNFNVAVQEWRGKVVFLRKLAPGGSSRSYGIEVARLAGLDRWVVNRSRRVLTALEEGDVEGDVPVRARPGAASGQLGLFDRAPASPQPSVDELEVLGELRGLDPNSLTPIEALNHLASLVGRLADGKKN